MKNALKHDEMVTLSTVLLTNLDEGVFFSKLSKFIQKTFGAYKVLAFEAFEDESTLLRSQNGKIVKNADILGKGIGPSGYVVRTKRAYYSNSRRDPILSLLAEDENIQGALCVPLTSEGRILGTVLILSDDIDNKFSEKEITIINEIFSEIDCSIKNMSLYLTAKNLNKALINKIELKNQELKVGPGIVKATAAQKIDILGHSKEVVDVLAIAKKVAMEDFPVLVTGLLGTGKKLLARKIHSLSSRASSPAMVVHCAAIDESALELELFGMRDQKGLIERVNGGTLIFDSIDELSLNMQAKILRVMMSGEIYPVQSKSAKKVNIRVISTSKRNLMDLVEEGTFREDLYYRLNIVGVTMPALSDRADDIKILAEYFLNNGKKKEESKMLTSKAIEKLVSYNWPGNIQELRNLMERTYIVAAERYIDESHLPTLVVEEECPEEKIEEFKEMSLHDLEQIHICKTLDFLGGNKTRAAKSLGITVKTLYNKLHSYGLVRSKTDV